MNTDGELIDSGIITSESESLGEKLLDLEQGLNLVLSDHAPAWIGIEDTYAQNIITMKTLSKFAGVAIKCACENHGIGLCYSDKTIAKAMKVKRKAPPDKGILVLVPTEIVKLVGIKSGKLDREQKKEEVRHWVNQTYGTSYTIEDNDETDAIAIAVATINKIRELRPEYW